MKNLYLLALSIFFISSSDAAPVIKAAINNGPWKSTNTWDLNRKPQNGDTIIIPAGKTVLLNDQETLNNVYIKVQGTLKLVNVLSYLALNTTSTIMVYSGGDIAATVDYLQYIFIGNTTIFSSGDVVGPKMAGGSAGSSFSSFSPMPVKFIGFTLTLQTGHDVLVQWSTAEEVNARMFEIEKSINGTDWKTMGSVAAAGNSKDLKNYSYSDRGAGNATLYYRIKETDIDGHLTYTPIMSVKTGTGTEGIKIASVDGKILIQFAQQVKGTVNVSLVGMGGQVMSQQILSNPVGQVVLASNLKGHFVVAVSNDSDVQTANQIIL